VCSEFEGNRSVVYVGYKNAGFNLVLPVIVTGSPLPFILSLATVAAGYVWKYFWTKKQEKSN